MYIKNTRDNACSRIGTLIWHGLDIDVFQLVNNYYQLFIWQESYGGTYKFISQPVLERAISAYFASGFEISIQEYVDKLGLHLEPAESCGDNQ